MIGIRVKPSHQSLKAFNKHLIKNSENTSDYWFHPNPIGIIQAQLKSVGESSFYTTVSNEPPKAQRARNRSGK